MRSGELQALKWDKVDLEKNIIMVHVTYNPNVKNPDKKFGQTKGRYWRTVPIAQDLRDLLLDLKLIRNLIRMVLFYLAFVNGKMVIKLLL